MSFKSRIKNEFKEAIPVIIYFVVIFNLIHFVTDLAIKPENRPYYSVTTVTIWALVAAKVLLIVDVLPFINLFPRKPLVYNITWKFFLYSFASLLFRMMDIIIHEHHRYGSFEKAFDKLAILLATPLFWSIQLFLMMTLFAFVLFREVARAVGKQQMKVMLFG